MLSVKHQKVNEIYFAFIWRLCSSFFFLITKIEIIVGNSYSIKISFKSTELLIMCKLLQRPDTLTS